jgi:glycosyltransferase involved in cell wall biosynthesis
MPLSIFLITFNEVDRIKATIEAVRPLSNDIIVVDSGSTDGTQALASRLGARVMVHPWAGFGEQKRFAESQCCHDFVLNLDADEVLSPALVSEIRALFSAGDPPCDAYTLRIAEIFPFEQHPHPFTYTLHPVRLYRRSKGSYNPSPVHDRVDLVTGTTIGHLKGLVHHYSVRSLGDQLVKLNRYSDAQAADLKARSIYLPVWRLYTEFPLAFLKAFLLRRHILRGSYGFLTAMNYAISRHLRIAKHLEQRWQEGKQMKEEKRP